MICSLIPIAIYKNADTNKKKAIEDNRGKSGIYRFTHISSGKTYVGSSINLGRRLTSYYSFLYINAQKSSLICRALLKYGYSCFSIEILEYCEKENLLVREQYYLDLLKPDYNILTKAGSSLGFKHSEDTIAKFRARRHTKETLGKFKSRVLSEESRKKIITRKGWIVVVTDLLTGKMNEYSSIHVTADELKAPYSTIRYYIKNQKIYKGRYKINLK